MSRPQLFTRGLSGLSQESDPNSPAEQRDNAKQNFLKTMRPLPTQHYWNVWFDGYAYSNPTQSSFPLFPFSDLLLQSASPIPFLPLFPFFFNRRLPQD